MNCPGCGNELAKHEIAQAALIAGRWIRPASFCDACCRQHTTKPGSPEALERLVTGQVDDDEAARLAELVQAPFERVGAILPRATKRLPFVAPEPRP